MSSSPKTGTVAASQTAKIAEIICGITYESLDEATVTAVKRLIADGIAVAIAGTREAAPGIFAEYVRDLACGPQSTVWGFGFKTSPAYAAYANAVSMHVLDFEPMSLPSTHAVSPTVPVALALAEARQASGRKVIAACAKGFEIQGRILISARPARGSLPFHSPGVMGLMGSAVTASHMLGLNPVQLANALGMAASRCAGLPANSGSMVKCTHCGNAASAGLEAAMLAARGFTSHPGILEAHHGYVSTFFPKQFDYDVLYEFGKPYRCADPGMAIKFYPSKYPTHFAISAALDVRQSIKDLTGIQKIRIVSPEILDANRPQPRVGLEGKFSIQYTACAAMLDGKVGIQSFTDERRFRADMVDLLGKTTLEFDKSIPPDTSKMHIDVEVTMADGTKHSRTCHKPPGTWGLPIDQDQHRAKIRDCLGARLEESKLGQALDLLDNLERLTAQDIAQLMAVLA